MKCIRFLPGGMRGSLSSYLIEITRDILAYKDEDNTPLIDSILDAAGQKGTGKWTVIAALDAGIPLSLISESVFARCLSAQKDQRVAASKILPGPVLNTQEIQKQFLFDLEKALYLAKMISYAQGFNLMQEASDEYNWDLNYGEIARIWRGGCIIRSVFLDKITEAYLENPQSGKPSPRPLFSGENCRGPGQPADCAGDGNQSWHSSPMSFQCSKLL